MLLYGQSGTGKTTFWATFPGPVMCLVCSGGNKPGELRSIDTPEYRQKITPVIVESSDELKNVLEKEAAGYATVVLDHATGLADLILKEVLGILELPAQKGWGLASQQQYGQVSLQAKEYLRAMLNLPGNVVIVAQERVFGGGEEQQSDVLRPTVGAALTPSLVGWLNPACDYVVQTYKRPKTKEVTTQVGNKSVTTRQRDKGVDYCLRTEPHDTYTTKFRIPRGIPLPECIVDPTYDKMMSLIRGEG